MSGEAPGPTRLRLRTDQGMLLCHGNTCNDAPLRYIQIIFDTNRLQCKSTPLAGCQLRSTLDAITPCRDQWRSQQVPPMEQDNKENANMQLKCSCRSVNTGVIILLV